MYNHCFNARETASHNKKRDLHDSQALKDKPAIAIAIQDILNKLPRGEPVVMPSAPKRPALYQNCGENVFTSKDRRALLTSSASTDAWYAGSALYDFTAHKPKNTAVTAASD